MDIDAVLTVIKRRSELSRKREVANAWRLDLRRAVLKRAHLRDAHLEWANLGGAHLEHADLRGAHLEHADLRGAHLERASLSDAYLKEANLRGSHFERPSLRSAHLDGAKLSSAKGLSDTALAPSDGDALTQLPEGMAPPAHWLAGQREGPPEDGPSMGVQGVEPQGDPWQLEQENRKLKQVDPPLTRGIRALQDITTKTGDANGPPPIKLLSPII